MAIGSADGKVVINLVNNGTTQLMNKKASPCPIMVLMIVTSILLHTGLMNQIAGFLHKIEA